MVIRITSSIIFVKTKYGIIHYKVSSNGFISKWLEIYEISDTNHHFTQYL